MKPWLLLDTSASRAIVALWDGEVRAVESLEGARRHAEELPGAIDRVCPNKDIGGVCVGVGPGSFVGVRVGMATAKGFARALDVPLIGVCSLAATVRDTLGRGFVALDARRNEVYMRPILNGHPEGDPRALAPELASQRMAGASFVVTNCRELLDQSLPLVDEPGPNELGLARLLATALATGQADQRAHLVPVYGRSPDARLPGAAR